MWGLPFASVGDPHHEISEACRERGLLELFVNPEIELIQQSSGQKLSHPKGYFQPGVLALASEGRVLYRWRGRPTRRNLGGAAARPTAEHVYASVSRALADSAASGEAKDADLDADPVLDSRGIPWPLFVSVLVANGWFIAPRPFPFRVAGPSVKTRILRAILRIPVFVAMWGIALVLLPPVWVGLAFVAWAAWLTPRIRFINEQFQNVPEEEARGPAETG